MPVVEVLADTAEAELAADALWQAGAGAVSETALGEGRVRLIAEVADVERIDARWGARTVAPDAEGHLDAWRAFATPQRAGRHLVLQPTWVSDAEVDPDDVVLRLDPGRSFGSGSHPSTRMVLAVLEAERPRGARVLDVGCGSGVLAVAAARLGAAVVVAIDVETDAVAVTTANAVANGVGDRVQASTTPLADVEGPFEVAVANIGARVLCELAPELIARVAPGGLLVLAGLLDEQGDEVAAAYEGCAEVARPGEAGWCALVLRA